MGDEVSAQFETPDEMRRRYAAIRARLNLRTAVVERLPPRRPPRPSGPPYDIISLYPSRKIYAEPAGPHLPENTNPRDRAIAALVYVSRKYGVSIEDIKSERRQKFIIPARHEAIWMVRSLTPWGLPKIGKFFGDRDHTTCLHAIRKHQAKVDRGEV